MSSDPDDRPVLRVIRGRPTDVEVAALVAVVAARSATGRPAPTEAPAAAGRQGEPTASWAARQALVRSGRPLPTGPGAWARSGREPGVRTRAGW